MAILLAVLLGFFVVIVLPILIQQGYDKRNRILKNRKLEQKQYENQRFINEIKTNFTNVQSNDRIYFSNGFYDIRTDKFDYFLSEDGNRILGPYTKIIESFWGDNSLASVLINNDVFYIDNQGNKVLGPFKEYKCLDGWLKYSKYKGIPYSVKYEPFKNGYAVLNICRKRSFFDINAKVIINNEGKVIHVAKSEDFITGFSEGLVAIKKEDKVYFVNEQKEEMLGPYEYSSFWPYHTKFVEGLAVVRENSKYWYIDKNGKKVLGPYDRAYSFTKEGFACVITKDGFGCIDRQGKFIWGPSAEYREMKYAPSDGCVVLYMPRGGNYSIIDVLNNKIVGTYKDVTPVVNGNALVKVGSGEHYIVNKNGTTKRLENMGYGLLGLLSVVQSSSNGRYSVNLKNDSEKIFYSIDHNGKMLKMSEGVAELLKRTPNLKLKINNNDGQEEQEVQESQEEFNPFIEAYLKAFPNEEQDARAEECAAKNRAALFEASKSKAQENKTTTIVVSRPELKANFNGKEDGYNVVGVQFDNYKSGCYYYYGDNKIYNIGDRVLVPTGNNGNQEVTVVFRKIYKNRADIPYNGNLKTVIRKLYDNGSNIKKYDDFNEVDFDCDDMSDIMYDDNYVTEDNEGDSYNSSYEDGPWWDTTKMSNPDDTDYE